MAGRFPVLVDEHVPRSFVQTLQRRGWTVVRVVDLKTELGQGSDDEQVFTYAVEKSYVVLSSDERALCARRNIASRASRSAACCAGRSATAIK